MPGDQRQVPVTSPSDKKEKRESLMNFFQKLLSRRSSGEQEQHAPELDTSQSALLDSLTPGLTVAKASDIGQVRGRNEDAFLVIDAAFQSDGGLAPLGLYIIADGMGGHQKGEVASSTAVRVAACHILQDVFVPFLSEQGQDSQRRPINEALVEAVEAANLAVHTQVPEAGTTLTAALIFGYRVYLAHVGDSRAYLFSHGKLQQITQDHSLVARLVELGQATPEEALTHAHRNVLYRAIGQAGSLEVDTYNQPFSEGSCLLLCSDGLWGTVSDQAITDILGTASSLQDALDRLIATANQNGGSDNITAILVAMGES
jgi:serine/threonine protein phosphatase PrpC